MPGHTFLINSTTFESNIMLKQVLGIVLAGRRGEEDNPLTLNRPKAAIPFGGKYRIIDFALSNALNSGLRRLLVLTQYKSHSLNKHLRDGWSIFNPELGEYITSVPPQMRTGGFWYRGAADALLQNLYLIKRSGSQEVLILPGDHIFRMDVAPAVEFHRQKQAKVTIITGEKTAAEWQVECNDEKQVTHFSHLNKPTDIEKTTTPMGIYIFSTDYLIQLLTNKPENEQHLLEELIAPHVGTEAIYSYVFGGKEGRVSQDQYWQAIHSADDYFQASMDLLKYKPPLDLHQANWPIRSYIGQYPPARTAPGQTGNEGIFINSIIGAGSVVTGASIQTSILFNNVRVNDESMIENSIIFDNVKIGKRCQMINCIIDKNVVIPDDTIIDANSKDIPKDWHVTPNGIVIISAPPDSN